MFKVQCPQYNKILVLWNGLFEKRGLLEGSLDQQMHPAALRQF